jgi:hypothetical protein
LGSIGASVGSADALSSADAVGSGAVVASVEAAGADDVVAAPHATTNIMTTTIKTAGVNSLLTIYVPPPANSTIVGTRGSTESEQH